MSIRPERFPHQKYESAEGYFDAYRDNISRAWASLTGVAIARAVDLLRACILRDGVIYACGNGGSAAIANHLLCDFHKGLQTDTPLKPRVVSLSSHLELITAIANDVCYEDVFVYQLRALARPSDLLITISSSGNSENIVRAAAWAKDNGLPVVSLVGFSGGRSAELCDATIHVKAENYGIIEDVHQSVMHILAQFLRQSSMTPELIEQRTF